MRILIAGGHVEQPIPTGDEVVSTGVANAWQGVHLGDRPEP